MPQHTEKRILTYSPQQMYGLVADIESYPAFIPWCEGALIRREFIRDGKKILDAELKISFKVYHETFKSEVTLMPEMQEISIRYLEGPLKHLKSYWIFHKVDQGCEVEYHVDFEFRSKIVQKLVGIVFFEAMQRIVNSFEKRAKEVFCN